MDGGGSVVVVVVNGYALNRIEILPFCSVFKDCFRLPHKRKAPLFDYIHFNLQIVENLFSIAQKKTAD